MASTVPCSVCREKEFRPCFQQHGRRFESCCVCGFVRMVEPRYQEELVAHYRDDRLHGEQAWQRHDWFVARFDDLVAHLERYVRPGRLLDVGCSYGSSLLAARARGWDVVGVELSHPAAEYGIESYGLDIRMVPLHEAGFEPETFDAVLMHHVLEHLPDPDVIVSQVLDLLKPGGAHFQGLPNYGALKRRLLGRCWSFGITPRHLCHFTPRTLRAMLERVGFEVLEWWTPSARDDPRLLYDVMRRLHVIDRFMAWRGKAGEPFDAEEYLCFLNERRWARWLSNRGWPAPLVRRLRLGEELFMVARKPETSSVRLRRRDRRDGDTEAAIRQRGMPAG